MSSVLRCTDVAFGYGCSKVVKGLTFDVEKGDCILIVGRNGSGKSTLVKGIVGLIPLMQGTIEVSDRVKKNGIAYLPQKTEAQANFPITVMEVVMSGRAKNSILKVWYSRHDREIATKAMKTTGVHELRKKCFRELSGGQQQRVLIARALCTESELLVMDEPATGLDAEAKKSLVETIKSLNKEGISTIMVTHNMEDERDIPYCVMIKIGDE